MQTVKRAALAPAQPSGQDRAVASQAGAIEAQARKEMAMQRAGGGSGIKEHGKASKDGDFELSKNDNPVSKKADIETYSSDGKARSSQESQNIYSVYA
jgi:hypothetical protein